jgi:amidophosphoribosyltransferase
MCAIFGIAGDPEASYLTYLGLHSLQHRGQEGAGLVSTDGVNHCIHRKQGVVTDVFKNVNSLKGHAAIGHTRYSTTGSDTIANLQPLCMKSSLGWMAIAHNGNLVNAEDWVEALEDDGAIFQTTTDTEVIMHLIARCKGMDFCDAIVCALNQIEGAYSLLIMNTEYLIAIRDPYGFRPLVMGNYQDKPVFASETCAFDLIGAKQTCEVKPGEMVMVNLKTLEITRRSFAKPSALNRCVFELIYFARPDSVTFGSSVYETRKNLGRKLAQEHPAQADIVVPVPDSGIGAAIGYAEQMKLPFEMGIIRSHYMRTFIQPKQSQRDLGVRLKLSAIPSLLVGKRVVVVDDSLVRGTTSRKIIGMLREAGAKEVHLRVSAPPTISPCYYGIDTPTKGELIAHYLSVNQIRDFIGADSLGYLSIQGLKEVSGSGFCNGCFSGDYPTLIQLGRRDKVT